MKILPLLLAFLLIAGCAYAFTNDQIADAIYKAEGGAKATYLYGIRSIPYQTEAEARRICLNTIKNNRRRFKEQNRYIDYLEFLSSRYAPLNAENDPNGLNVNWLRNVRYFLQKGD